MSYKKIVIFLIIALAILGLAIYFLPFRNGDTNNGQSGSSAQTAAENYIRRNISTLSLEPAALGGTFYVTEVTFDGDNSGQVSYEDGHVAYVANFTYSINSSGGVSISSFEIVPEPKVFLSEELGLRFNYPANYFQEVKNLGTAGQRHISIILTEDTEENRQVRDGLAPGREGPVSINVDVYQNDSPNLTAENWIRTATSSNFKLSPDGVLTPTTVAGRPAVSYRSSGLYEIDYVVMATDKFIYSFAVNYLTPEDTIRKDYFELLKSVVLLNQSV